MLDTLSASNFYSKIGNFSWTKNSNFSFRYNRNTSSTLMISIEGIKSLKEFWKLTSCKSSLKREIHSIGKEFLNLRSDFVFINRIHLFIYFLEVILDFV